MSVTDPLGAIRLQILGSKVERPAALQPQTTQAPIFNVVGGKVLVTALVGEVVVATPATVNALKVTGNPTVGTDVDWCSNGSSTASKEAGTIITLPASAASALVINPAGGGNTLPLSGWIGQVGTLDLVSTGSAATGTIKWTITYIPIDTGAAITVA